ncbi:VOC family protein [Saccharopolyspora sp. ID03-671]|uniref:VOC family protein n=1 Tax=Saccharopolyspora sp. ID03-671 TaxID=3073066 RepID=UPI00325303EE
MYAIDFVEFPSSAASSSGRFFARAFGWTTTPYGPDYADVAGAGIALGFQSDPDERPPAPLVTIRADDLDQARRDVESAGGVITVEPFEFPGGRRFHFREPGGCELAVWRPT